MIHHDQQIEKSVRQKEKKFFSLTNLYRILTSRPFLDFVE